MSNIGPADFERLDEMPREMAALWVDTHLREMEKSQKRSFAERGLLLKAAEEREYWREVFDNETGQNYSSMERWICGACPYSRSDCFAAMRAVKELKDIPIDRLLNIPRCNIQVLIRLSSKVRENPTVLSRAESLSEKDFLEWLASNFEEQHIDPPARMHLAPTTSAKVVIDEAIEMAKIVEECSGREEAMEAICVSYMDENRGRYQMMLKARGVA